MSDVAGRRRSALADRLRLERELGQGGWFGEGGGRLAFDADWAGPRRVAPRSGNVWFLEGLE